MSSNIKPRRGCEVYLNDEGEIVIRQEDFGQEQYVILHHEEARELITILENRYQESLDFIPESTLEPQSD